MQKLLPTVMLLFLFFSFFSLFVQFKHILEEEGGGCRGGGWMLPVQTVHPEGNGGDGA